MKSLKEINTDEFSVALPAPLHGELAHHLLKNQDVEDVAFALYKPSMGTTRFTGLIYKILVPGEKDRIQRGFSVDIMPEFFKRVCREAATERSGIALVHSHPRPGWQNMSEDDVKTENSYSPICLTLTDLPLIGMTLATDETWSARIWEYDSGEYEHKTAATVRVIGKRINVSYCDRLRPHPEFKETFKRTVSVWGTLKHGHLARLRIGIVGLGSVGSIVAETLARMGMEQLVLLDFDEVQKHNLDRLLIADADDIGSLKTDVAERRLKKSATAAHFNVVNAPFAITEEDGYRKALDCDVLFCCVDRPWPRSVLNHLAYNHLIPVIDGGIKVRLNRESLAFEGADWQLQAVGPERPCLRCLGAFNPAHVSTEIEGKLDDPFYLEGLPEDHEFKRNENIFPFSANLASLEVMQFIEMVTGIGGITYGPQRYSYNHGYIRLLEKDKCVDGCDYSQGIAMGDTFYPAPIGHDHAAEAARKRQK